MPTRRGIDEPDGLLEKADNEMGPLLIAVLVTNHDAIVRRLVLFKVDKDTFPYVFVSKFSHRGSPLLAACTK
jgi:hypothetical protein